MASPGAAQSPEPVARGAARPKEDDSDDDSSDDILFKYPYRGEFKRKVDPDADDSEEADSDSDTGGDDAFNSSREVQRVDGAARADRSAAAAGRGTRDFLDILSSDDDFDEAPPTPKLPREVDEETIRAQVNAAIEGDLMGGGIGIGGSPQITAEDRAYNKRMRETIERVGKVDNPSRTAPLREVGAGSSAAAIAAEKVRKAAEARARRELERKQVVMIVARNKEQRHKFRVKLMTSVCSILEGCRREVALVSRDEQEADLSLYHEDACLDPEQTLYEAGLRGGATLRLVVGEAEATGPPITLKVRVEGGKKFTVATTKDINWSAFMESFVAAVGIPAERASECVFKFDGDKLNPKGTPEGEDMEDDDMVEAKLPSDVMADVQRSPSELKLVPPPRKKPAASSNARRGVAARSTTAAALLATAQPLGPGRATRSSTRSARSGGGSSSSDVIELD